jgi:hypothetical protein
MARKSKLTPELIGQIETSLQSHTSINATCDLVGITRETFFKWMREGESAKGGIKADFTDTVKKARAMSRVMLVNQISKDPSWQAKAWILERQFPEEFGRRQLIAHAGADGTSDLPAAVAPAVKLTINMQRAGGDAPWIFKAEQDQDPANGTDPWPTDQHGFDGDEIPPDNAAVSPPPEQFPAHDPAQAKGPTLPSRHGADMETIRERVRNITQTASPLDSGGRPRDPDDDE